MHVTSRSAAVRRHPGGSNSDGGAPRLSPGLAVPVVTAGLGRGRHSPAAVFHRIVAGDARVRTLGRRLRPRRTRAIVPASVGARARPLVDCRPSPVSTPPHGGCLRATRPKLRAPRSAGSARAANCDPSLRVRLGRSPPRRHSIQSASFESWRVARRPVADPAWPRLRLQWRPPLLDAGAPGDPASCPRGHPYTRLATGSLGLDHRTQSDFRGEQRSIESVTNWRVHATPHAGRIRLLLRRPVPPSGRHRRSGGRPVGGARPHKLEGEGRR